MSNKVSVEDFVLSKVTFKKRFLNDKIKLVLILVRNIGDWVVIGEFLQNPSPNQPSFHLEFIFVFSCQPDLSQSVSRQFTVTTIKYRHNWEAFCGVEGLDVKEVDPLFFQYYC